MHDGCNGSAGDGMQTLQKIRMMGFNNRPTPVVHEFECEACGVTVTMTTLEFKCPDCNMVYAVTPCSAHDVNNIKAAGKSV